jgi:response regulator RpfG family c-di-GMP phosphodiesterase
MSKIYILCVEDEPEVLDAVVKDLEIFEKNFPIETARSTIEARKIIESILKKNDKIGLIVCDHIMPVENGVDLLVELQKKKETAGSRKILLTGQAGLEATVKALNFANLDFYISKPWDKNELQFVVKKFLTDYVIDNEKNYLPFMSILDAARLSEAMITKGRVSDK